MTATDERPTTEAIYDGQADSWARRERLLLSDFTARPRVLERLGPLDGAHVLDLGCGEGYVSRLVLEAGAASVFGVDVSSEMVRIARESLPSTHAAVARYEAGDASRMETFSRERYDRVMAVFLFNYLTRAQMLAVLRRVRTMLAPGGRFVFTVPHPCLAYMREHAPPFYFDAEEASYKDGADQTFEGRIWRRDGTDVAVRCVHKTFSDYFVALRDAGFCGLPVVEELYATDEHLALDPEFFGPLKGQPLHVLFSVEPAT